MQKCNSWFGHKFIARYSTRIPGSLRSFKVGDPEFVEVIKDKIYEGDICVRCGVKINKETPK